jgi:glycosyltransferase involved in cell wall biosynthesis
MVSPSAYYAVRDAGFPVVQTLHNYRLSCPNIVFSRDGRTCTECLGRFFAWPGVRHGCFHGSRVATGAVASVQSIHRAAGTWRRAVDLYITPTNFARDMAVRAGVPPAKIRVKPHFVSPDPGPGDHSGGFALFVGRLSAEKGLPTLLDAWKMIAAPIPLRIVGDGPLRQLAADAAEHMAGVEWLGQRDAHEVSRLMGEAAFLICPSTAYETFGRVVAEAYARGTPVIGSAHGALQELIAVGETGYLFSPGSPASLATVVNEAWAHRNDLMRMSTACRRHFLDYYSAGANHERLLDIYREAQG